MLHQNIYSLPLIWCLFNLLISSSCRGGSRTHAGTKTDFFVRTSNDSQPLTVVTKNLEKPLSKLQYDRRQISPSQALL